MTKNCQKLNIKKTKQKMVIFSKIFGIFFLMASFCYFFTFKFQFSRGSDSHLAIPEAGSLRRQGFEGELELHQTTQEVTAVSETNVQPGDS